LKHVGIDEAIVELPHIVRERIRVTQVLIDSVKRLPQFFRIRVKGCDLRPIIQILIFSLKIFVSIS
jgi:hypothetical protein